MSHPDHPNHQHTYEIGRENIMVGMDHAFDPTDSNTIKPTSLLSNFISDSVTRKQFPNQLKKDDISIDDKELEAI